MTRAAKTFRTIFFEEPLLKDVASPALRQKTTTDGILVLTPILPQRMSPNEQESAQRTLLREILSSRRDSDIIAWYYTPLALHFSRGIEFSLSIYDNMDELSAFLGSPPRMIEAETELIVRADIIFTGGYSLYEAKRHRHNNIYAFPSSIDKDHFSRPEELLPAPEDLRWIASPRICFFGVIDERMDLDLVAGIARQRPDWNLVMIGPVVKIDANDLPQAPNIHWLGSRPYAALPQYLHLVDCGFMPFAINEATRFISPTKTPEFLAAGLPVVSTPIADVVRPYGSSGLVAIAETIDGFVSAIEDRLRPPGAAWLEAVDRYLSTTSWDLTWAAMLDIIEDSRQVAVVRQTNFLRGGALV
jgi:glycosyltransferase involved in cell wall biosynthesis